MQTIAAVECLSQSIRDCNQQVSEIQFQATMYSMSILSQSDPMYTGTFHFLSTFQRNLFPLSYPPSSVISSHFLIHFTLRPYVSLYILPISCVFVSRFYYIFTYNLFENYFVFISFTLLYFRSNITNYLLYSHLCLQFLFINRLL